MRRSSNYTIGDEGRDFGKLFVLTEMSASQGEDWALRALLALVQANVEVPDNFAELGMAGLAEVGIKKLGALPVAIARPLLEELMGCIQIIPDPRKPMVIRPLIEDDIEEVTTRIKLKWEVLKLHVDFSKAAALSDSLIGLFPKASGKRPVSQTRRKR